MPNNTDHDFDIPAYLRGELTAQTRAEIEALIAENPEFAAEVDFQNALRNTLRSNSDENLDTAFGWERLSKAIDDEDKHVEVPVPSKSPVPVDVPIPANDRGLPSKIWQYAAVALACVVIGQGFALVNEGPGEDDKYVMAGMSETAVTMSVKLSDKSLPNSLTEFLLEHQGLITTGPDATGQYELSFDSLETCELAHDVLNARDELFETFSPCQDR